MRFKEFASYLERLEKISSRLGIIEVVAELIGKLNGDEVAYGVYLSLGELAPNFRGIEFNMAEKMVMRGLVGWSGEKEDRIVARYKKCGDLGIVAEEINDAKGNDKLTLTDVYWGLKEMAEDSGAKSQERKVEKLIKLLVLLDGKSSKYVVRMVIGKLRLGFSDKTILEALSKFESGNRSLRKELDSMYQIYPDVGKLSKLVKEDGIAKAKEKLNLEVGVPVMPALCQRLNTSAEIISKMGRVAVERKFDGTRVQIHFNKEGVKTFSRNLEETSWMFPELGEMKNWIDAKEAIFDCEAVGYDPKTDKILPFQETITRKRKHGIEEVAGRVPLRFNIFDLLYLDGKALIDEPYETRRKKLAEVIRKNKSVVIDDYYLTDNPEELREYHEKFLKEGYEGAVVKKRTGKYLPGRQGWNWVKIKEAEGARGKLKDTLDLVVMGYYRGRGKRSGFGLGAFLVGVVNDDKVLTIAKIGTGLSDDQFKELKRKLDNEVSINKPKNYVVDSSLEADVWVDPKLVVEIAADEITKSPVHSAGVALRFPRLVRFREDKSVQQATTKAELVRIKG